MLEIGIATLHRVFKNRTNMRVSNSGMHSMRKYLESHIEEVAVLARDVAKNSNRSTIKREDVELALKILNE